MKNIWLSIIVVGVLVAAGVGGTFAGFVDTEESEGNFLQAGILDLLVNGKNDPIGAKLQYTHAVPCISQDFWIDLFSWSKCQGANVYMKIKNVDSVEAGYKTHGSNYLYDGTTVLGGGIPDGYVVGTDPTGAGIATSEPELIAEEGGGEFGQCVVGLNDPAKTWQENLALSQGLGVDYASGISEHLGVTVKVCDDGADGILDDADTGEGADTAGDGVIGPAEQAAHNWVTITAFSAKLCTLNGVKVLLGFLESQTYAWIHVDVHLQQIEDTNWGDYQTRYWPTNALQGDKATWDMLFELNTD